jgi:hypothetical protein
MLEQILLLNHLNWREQLGLLNLHLGELLLQW